MVSSVCISYIFWIQEFADVKKDFERMKIGLDLVKNGLLTRQDGRETVENTSKSIMRLRNRPTTSVVTLTWCSDEVLLCRSKASRH